MTDDLTLLKERVNLRVQLWSVLIALAGLGILFLSTPIEKAGYQKSGILLQEAGAALFIAGVLAVIWELAGKRAFADEILAKANMARDLAEAGVDTIVESFKDHRIDLGGSIQECMSPRHVRCLGRNLAKHPSGTN